MIKHFGVSVHIFNPENKKFLLIKHKKTGMWLQPGGHIERNEDPEEAAHREVFEETGLYINLMGKRFPRNQDFITPLAIQKDIINESHIHADFVYLGIPLENQSEKINHKETEGLNWFSVNEINSENFTTFKDLKNWCEYILKNYSFII